MRIAPLVAAAALALAAPVFAQSDDDPHAGHDSHAGHDMSGSADTDTAKPAGTEPPPTPPTEHAADRLFSRAEMDAAREQLRREHGGSRAAMLLLNLAEYQVRSQRDGYRWDGEGWFGGDIHRLVVKSEGEGAAGGDVDDAELQLVYSRAVSPYFDLQAGVRYDFEPNPSRTYGTIGFEGLAPYWFEVEGTLFLSERADLLARLEGYYDQPITQRLILQPRVEFNFAAQDV
ncbi:MAG: copper resistance protein B, partial [Burkholderiales bacterium]